MSEFEIKLACFCLCAILPKGLGIYAKQGPFGRWYAVVCHPSGRQDKYSHLQEVIDLLPEAPRYGA